jgi:hypothetical protein
MHEKEINKFISYGIGIIVAYYLVSAFIGYIILGVAGMIAWRLYLNHNKMK